MEPKLLSGSDNIHVVNMKLCSDVMPLYIGW